jgi:PAS domain-containing protein
VTNLTRERFRIISIGVVAALAAALVRAVLFRFVGTGIPFLTFIPAIIVAALWGGTSAGVVTSALSFFLAPLWMGENPMAFDRGELLNLSFFLLTCVLIVWAVRRAHWARLESVALGAKPAESEARFRYLADNIPQLTWMARPDGHIFWYNRRWFEYTGLRRRKWTAGAGKSARSGLAARSHQNVETRAANGRAVGAHLSPASA